MIRRGRSAQRGVAPTHRRLAMETSMRPALALVAGALLLAGLAACEHKPSKEEEEAAKSTFACRLAGQRLVIRFDLGEARMLTATGEKITLYQIPAASGVRYSNGSMELRGNDRDLTLIEYGVATKLESCEPYSAPKT
jgi:membrane-bound inhibitor of C-type lysozyme